MSWFVFSAVLAAALMHASWNALVKSGGDKLVVMTLLCAAASALAILSFVLYLPLPPSETWGYLSLSLVAHLGYKLFLARAYQDGALGQIYPVARGATPMIVLLLAFAFADEIPNLMQVLAVLLIAGGVFSLAFLDQDKRVSMRALMFALASASCIAVYSLIDGLAARCCGAPHSYVAAVLALDVVPILVITILSRRAKLLRAVKDNWKAGAISGVLSALAYWIVVYAMTQAPIASVSALRETSVMIAALIGLFVLREENARKRLLPAGAILVAVVLLKL